MDGRVKCLNPWDVQSKHIVLPEGVSESLCAGEKRWGSLPPMVCFEKEIVQMDERLIVEREFVMYESLPKDNRSIMREQPSRQLHRAGCVQRYASGLQEE